MHHTEIDHEASVTNSGFDLEDDFYGERPILLTFFAPVDNSDVLVPVDESNREGRTLALTEEQGMQAVLELAGQLGKASVIAALGELED